MVPQLDRTQAEGFDGAFVVARLDILAGSKRVVEQIEDAADDVLDDRLSAEADCNADNPRSRDKRSDLDAQRGERHH